MDIDLIRKSLFIHKHYFRESGDVFRRIFFFVLVLTIKKKIVSRQTILQNLQVAFYFLAVLCIRCHF